jgi:hypothetical protein
MQKQQLSTKIPISRANYRSVPDRRNSFLKSLLLTKKTLLTSILMAMMILTRKATIQFIDKLIFLLKQSENLTSKKELALPKSEIQCSMIKNMV